MKLHEAEQGHLYKIVKISGEGKIRRRLLDMGFIAGTKLELKRVTPMGGTFLVNVRDFSVALREDAADCIEVTRACGHE